MIVPATLLDTDPTLVGNDVPAELDKKAVNVLPALNVPLMVYDTVTSLPGHTVAAGKVTLVIVCARLWLVSPAMHIQVSKQEYNIRPFISKE